MSEMAKGLGTSSISDYSCCCCMPSETYGRNGVTPIFRSFHRTASSTTGGWSCWNILMCVLYIILSTTVSFLEDTIFLLLGLLFFYFVYISIFFLQVHCMCVMYLTSFDGFF